MNEEMNIVPQLKKILAGLTGATILVLGFLAYYMKSVGPDKLVYDGLGRQLVEAPSIFIFGDRMWSGFWWTATDFIIFWGSVGLIYFLLTEKK